VEKVSLEMWLALADSWHIDEVTRLSWYEAWTQEQDVSNVLSPHKTSFLIVPHTFTTSSFCYVPAEDRVPSQLPLQWDYHRKTLTCSCLSGPSSVVPKTVNKKIKEPTSSQKTGVQITKPLDFDVGIAQSQKPLWFKYISPKFRQCFN